MHKVIPLLTENTMLLNCKISTDNAVGEIKAVYSYAYELHTYTAGAKFRCFSS
jgi:hypothetical protein